MALSARQAPETTRHSLLDTAQKELDVAISDVQSIASQVQAIADAALGCVPECDAQSGVSEPTPDGAGYRLCSMIGHLRRSLDDLRGQVHRLQAL